MNPVPLQFQPRGDDDLLALVSEHPLAWVVSEDLAALLLPLRPIRDAAGGLLGFSGHFPRSSRQLERLMANPRALMLFTGPTVYVSPSWFENRAQAPTWMSISGAFDCALVFSENPAELASGLRDLVDAMEHGRPHPWSVDELGDRYEKLASHIVPFHAEITSHRAAFRLCQDEDDQTFTETLRGVRADGGERIAALMEEFRPWRKGEPSPADRQKPPGHLRIISS
ncbi:MAG: FMN-binding negative transcriptional regulator [Sphingosinicella sp.]|nr:FMN-binding negative transcriptional regulator [Sphingosinicella sp.]